MKKWIVLLAALAPMYQVSAAPADSAPAHGAETRAWLNLQRSGRAASREARPMSGDVADTVYQRYLKSFSHPIPQSFQRESIVGAGGGGSSGSAGGQ